METIVARVCFKDFLMRLISMAEQMLAKEERSERHGGEISERNSNLG